MSVAVFKKTELRGDTQGVQSMDRPLTILEGGQRYEAEGTYEY